MDLGSSLLHHDDVWGSEGIAPPFLTAALDASSQFHALIVLTPGKNRGTHCIGSRVAPEPVCLLYKNISPLLGISSASLVAQPVAQSLYRLSYPGNTDSAVGSQLSTPAL
jgi:hypothetical protein